MKKEANDNLDLAAAHRHFSTHCFNAAWDEIEKDERNQAESEAMLHLAHASYYHWTQRSDFHPNNQSIGLWQLSRVYVLAGQPYLAVHYARQCIQASETHQLEPFYVAYAYEGLARAQQEIGLNEEALLSLRYAGELSEQVENKKERKQLLKDINELAEKLTKKQA